MAVRTRRLSIFSHPPAFHTKTQPLLLFPAILFAFVMAIFWLYIPPLQRTLNTTSVPAIHYFLPAAFGVGIVVLDELHSGVLVNVGQSDQLTERFYAITAQHGHAIEPLEQLLQQTARADVFA